MKVKYTGPAKDYSGYGEANRHDIGALVAAGIQVTTELPSYVNEISDYGRLGRLALELEGLEIGYNIKIIHTTPDQCPRFIEEGKYNIARVFWETNQIPEEYAKGLENIDEIWTGSQFGKEAIEKGGVTKPIFVIPESIDIDMENLESYTIPAEGLKFYSIFEWSERKNPLGLLEAYWTEFGEGDRVSLTIKTFAEGFQGRHKDKITQDIKKLRDRLNLSYYAPVYIYRELMDRSQIYRFHQSFDCFVSAHRGEGWGIPQMEAMLVGKPVISTGVGGIHEYLEHKKTALLIDSLPVRVQGDRKWYESNQKWANPIQESIRENMRYAYRNPKRVAKIASRAQEFVKENFSLEVVGQKMRERLVAI